MTSRPVAKPVFAPLLALIERRFGLRLSGSVEHLRQVHEHYLRKRKLLLWEHGEAGALARKDYGKAVLISETAYLMLNDTSRQKRTRP
jgi:hypothetical protein